MNFRPIQNHSRLTFADCNPVTSYMIWTNISPPSHRGTDNCPKIGRAKLVSTTCNRYHWIGSLNAGATSNLGMIPAICGVGCGTQGPISHQQSPASNASPSFLSYYTQAIVFQPPPLPLNLSTQTNQATFPFVLCAFHRYGGCQHLQQPCETTGVYEEG